MISMDTLKIAENKKVSKKLPSDQPILLSAKLIKINHVNKRQERVIVLTNAALYNMGSPSSFFAYKLKRRIPLQQIIGITVSRYGTEFVIHIDGEDDYRCSSQNLKIKIVEMIVDAFCKHNKKKIAMYFYDDLTLQIYTTTVDDIDKKRRKAYRTTPVYMDGESIKKNEVAKHDSKLIFRSQNSNKVETFEEFQILKVLGRGAFGKVMLCQHKTTQQLYAVKSMRKEDLIQKSSIQRTKVERYLMEKVNHPFLVSLEYAFQTKEKVFFVMKFYRGGQVFTRLRREKTFSESRAKFYAAQVFLALDYLHNLGYAYRDLKPQNILFDINGYVKVSDYGLCKEIQSGDKSYSLTGTPSYLSPEVILNQGHSYYVDWWALGILIYQMVYGFPPFYSKVQKDMFHNIVTKAVEFDDTDVKLSDSCKDIIRGLLKKYPNKRLGFGSSSQIKNHPWFSSINWEDLLKFKLKPDYIPAFDSQVDVSNFHEFFTKEEPINSIVPTDTILLNKYSKQFQGFDYGGRSTAGETIKQEEQQPIPQVMAFVKKKKPISEM